MYCGMTVEVHGRLAPHPWLENVRDAGFRENVLDLALARADAYGWQAPYGWRTPEGRKLHPVPDRWFDCDKGGDWSAGDGVRELAWLRADLPVDAPQPRLPVLPMTRVLSDALERVGEVTFTALRSLLPLQIAAGEAQADLEDMRDWFSLASPARNAEVRLTISAVPSPAWAAGEGARVRQAVRERLGAAATVDSAPPLRAADSAARAKSRSLLEGARPLAEFLCRTREWSPDLATWLTESAADALRSTGHAAPVMITASRMSDVQNREVSSGVGGSGVVRGPVGRSGVRPR